MSSVDAAPLPPVAPSPKAKASSKRVGRFLPWLLAVAGIAGVAAVQPNLAVTAHKVRQRDDAFLLPPPAQLRAMTLGYSSAAADLLWATLVLESGIHAQEHRPFPDLTRYADGILAVEPDFPTLYRFIDTMMMFRPEGAGPEQARVARAYLERGTRERPHDPEVWLMYGQFCAFLGPSFLKDESEIQAWRRDGALAVTHAVELGSDAQRSLAATSILSKAGESRATIQHLQRAYALTDDPEMRAQIVRKLASLQASLEAADATSVFEREWQTRYGFLSRGAALMIGPHRSASKCAGPSSYQREGCARDWTQAIEAVR